MVLGGIPYYWDQLKKGLSLSSNIDRIFVGKDAPLKNEDEHLFNALFEKPDVYLKIINALSNGTKAGMSYSDLIVATGEKKRF